MSTNNTNNTNSTNDTSDTASRVSLARSMVTPDLAAAFRAEIAAKEAALPARPRSATLSGLIASLQRGLVIAEDGDSDQEVEALMALLYIRDLLPGDCEISQLLDPAPNVLLDRDAFALCGEHANPLHWHVEDDVRFTCKDGCQIERSELQIDPDLGVRCLRTGYVDVIELDEYTGDGVIVVEA